MKVIANRFKVVFPNFISQEQAGFIAGRNIPDNVIIAQEVIHSMRSRKAGKNWMAIKLDLEKAYDRISRLNLLEEFGRGVLYHPIFLYFVWNG
ncbi:Retrovirus-related Pol polyprotein LINE-1 [Gossypium australe]|uniref:Retrovirus-related Pol polyprotein LINE-1 n=1 Tax=Gossypium australe TaxID=47621 RepID=A0A5B6WBK5_9ROSI|nr:Retrovirus-related Pol polyprotein LINE-1 [Gossypium australe]